MSTAAKEAVKTSCAWCDALNSTAVTTCQTCFHDAHVAREECGCPLCWSELVQKFSDRARERAVAHFDNSRK